MVTTRSNSEKVKHKNSLEKLTEYMSFKEGDISWLIDNLPVTVFRSSSKLSWGMDYISTNVEKLTGYSKMDFIEQKLMWSDVVYPEDIAIIDKAVKTAKRNKSSYQIEYRIKKADGNTAFIQEKAHIVCDDTGKLAYIAGVFLDLTSEAKLRADSQGLVKEDERIQLEMLQSFVKSLSRGEIPEPITDKYSSDLSEIKNNINNCIEGLQGLVECDNVLQRMAVNDHTKGVEGKYVGIFASTSEATNNVRERLLSVTSLVNDIAVGNTSQLEEFKKIRRRSEQDILVPAFIQALENIDLLIEDTGMLAKAGVEGKYEIRADVSKHHGEYKKIVQGFNDTLDAVINPMNAAIEDSLMLSKAAVEGKLDVRADITRHEGNFRKIISGLNDTLDAVIGPLNVAAEYIERIGRGEIPEPITENYKGDFNEIKNNLNNCIEGLQGLVECNNILQRMAMNDQTKGVEGQYVGIYASMAEATNLVHTRLLNVTNLLNNIAVGDSSQLEGLKKIGKRSEQDQLLPAIIRAMENVQLLIEDTEMLAGAGVEGKLDIRADASRHQGEFKKIVEGINDTLDAVVGPLNVAAEYIERISRGDIPQKITDNYNGDFNEIKNNLNNCIDGLQGLVECNNTLQRMAVNDYTKGVEGDYLGIYASMGKATNLVHDRVLNVTNVLENIAVGNTSRLPELKKIGKRSEQDHLMPAIIAAMDNVNLLIEDTEMLSRAALEGKLDIRADASKHNGEYRKVVEGINDTLDAVIGPLNVAAEYVERISRGDIPEHIMDNYNGDFNEVKNNLNTCIDAVNNLVEDALMLSKAGIAGQLEIRADASRHEGDFRKIIGGVNDTLDAVIGPLNEAIRVSNEFSNGNFRERFDEKLHVDGDFVNFKDVLNNIGISVSEMIRSAQSVAIQVAEHSDEASRGADEVAMAAGNVAASSQKSSELTRELLYKIEGINKEIIDLSASNEKIAVTSKGILSAADEVVHIGKDAQALGKDTNLKMKSVEKIAKESVEGINSLTEQIKQIDGIVQLINDITSQINLLSLNAAIEAARAGEYGRGFAVVAGEVKNLATKARNATETIENVVMSVQRDSKKTAEAITTANNEIIDGVNSVNKTLEALNTIIKNATQVTKDIGDVTKAIENQANISMKVVQASEEGNSMTQEVQREAEGLAATAQETSASVQEIGAAIHEVTGLSGRLKSELEAYMV